MLLTLLIISRSLNYVTHFVNDIQISKHKFALYSGLPHRVASFADNKCLVEGISRSEYGSSSGPNMTISSEPVNFCWWMGWGLGLVI